MPFRKSMLRREEQEDRPFDAEREPWKQKSGRQIDPSNREKWRTQMPEAERVLIERIVGHWLTDYGYVRPPVRWRPALFRRILRRLGRAAVRWGQRILHNLRSGRTFSEDASPQWMED
jgi:hypothetical protein